MPKKKKENHGPDRGSAVPLLAGPSPRIHRKSLCMHAVNDPI